METKAGPKKAKGGKKGRKIGRSENECKLYRANRTREKNKLIRMSKHIAKHKNDLAAVKRREQIL